MNLLKIQYRITVLRLVFSKERYLKMSSAKCILDMELFALLRFCQNVTLSHNFTLLGLHFQNMMMHKMQSIKQTIRNLKVAKLKLNGQQIRAYLLRVHLFHLKQMVPQIKNNQFELKIKAIKKKASIIIRRH